MPPHENPTVAELEAIEDPADRAAAAQAFITKQRATLRLVEDVRTRAIRQTRVADRRITIDELAAHIKAKRHIIVDALRRQKESSNS